jgi:hypothetical protein
VPPNPTSAAIKAADKDEKGKVDRHCHWMEFTRGKLCRLRAASQAPCAKTMTFPST